MRSALSFLLLGALILCGCAGKKGSAPAGGASAKAGTGPVWASVPATAETVSVTPATSSAGKVILVNPSIRYVVLNFPVGKMPAVEQRLGIYRSGSKVGEIKVTGPQREANIVADIVAGEAQVGDEARAQ